MKRLLSLFAILLFASSIIQANNPFGHRGTSDLTIRSDSRHEILVDIDGRSINRHPERTIVVRDLAAGERRITIIEPRFGFFGPSHRILFDDIVFIKPNARVIANLDRWGRLRLKQQVQHHCGHCGIDYFGNHTCQKPRPGRDWDHGYDRDYDRGYTNPGRGYGHQGGYQRYAMSPGQFSSLNQSIRRASFESTKKSIMRQGLQGQNITAQQLRRLLSQLSFENSKVEMAKWAYGKVVDKENIHVIYREFSFESSIRSLERHFTRW